MSARSSSKETSITSWGAVGGSVSGSCHVIEIGGDKVVIDFGLFQGRYDLAEMNKNKARGKAVVEKISEGDPSILVTHAHIDHYGFLPLLFRYGYNSTIYTTKETKQLMEANLTRSAKSQKINKSSGNFYFELEDVVKTLQHTQVVEPFEKIPVTKDKKIMATFCSNSHILGSCSVLLEDLSNGKNTLVTGDIGRPDQSVTGGYNSHASKYPQDPIHTLITESTCYPDTPILFEKRITSFINEINDAFQRGNTILMPCIQHRYMEIREIIHNCRIDGRLPEDIDFVVDGPALVDIANIYKKIDPDYLTKRYGDNPQFYDTESSQSRFDLDNFHIIRSQKKSRLLINSLGSSHTKRIIFTSGGMGNDGRSSDYFRSGFTKDPRKTVLFSCFQVDGTVGAELLKEQNNPKYCGAKVVKIKGFSGHATGREEISGYLKRYNIADVENLFIVHGSELSRKLMEADIEKIGLNEYVKTYRPNTGQRFDLV